MVVCVNRFKIILYVRGNLLKLLNLIQMSLNFITNLINFISIWLCVLSISLLSTFHWKKNTPLTSHTRDKKFITNAMQHNHMFFSCGVWHNVVYVMLRVIYRRWTTHVFSVVLSCRRRLMNSLTHSQKIYFLSAPLRKK